MKRKLVLIGAGSSMFTQGLVSNMISTSDEIYWELALVDIDPAALENMLALCRKMIEARQSNIQLTGSVERKEALQGADYVVTTIAVGGRRAWEKDVFIPRKYGVFQPVGDSVMPGGISRALRMIPAMLDIAKDVREICPESYFFNYSNPMTMICSAIMKSENANMVGLCHGVINIMRSLAEFINKNLEEVSGFAVGLNHLTFIYKFYQNGRPAWDLVRQALIEYESSCPSGKMLGRLFDEDGIEQSVADQPFAWEIFKSYGVYPAPGDRHIIEYFADQFPGYNYYGKKFGLDGYSFEDFIELGDKIYNKVVEEAHSPNPLPDDYFKKLLGEQEQLIDIILSIEYDRREIFSANMLNNGAVLGLPDNAVLEMPVCATADGFKPLRIDDFPQICIDLLLKHIGICDLSVKGALTGDKECVVQAILQGGYIHDRKKVIEMVDELILAHKEHLPQF